MHSEQNLLVSHRHVPLHLRNAVYQATGVYVNDAPVNPHHLFRSMKEQHMFEEGGEANV